VADIDEAASAQIAAEITDAGGSAVAAQGDVASPADWQRMVSTARHHLGPISGLVANAAHNELATVDELPEDSWNTIIRVNLSGTFSGIQACLPDLRATSGSIVVVSSVHARFGIPLHAAYAATKSGLEGLTRQLAVELGPNIRVNAVRPGPVFTAAWNDLSEFDRQRTADATVMGRMGTPIEIAHPLAFLLGPDSSFITGAVLTVDGGWSVAKDSA
jgi:NAD(P)-dependent dehydrogenase (short-subunit alcohol dehydrogenase family)